MDITAGTGQFPYRVVTELQKPVTLYERCPYVAFLLSSVFSSSKQLLMATDFRSEGFLTKKVAEGYYDGVFSPEVQRYYDGMALAYEDDSAVLYALGKSIVRFFSFRGRNFVRYQANGHFTTYITPEQIHAFVLKTLGVIADLRRQVKQKCLVRMGDSRQLLKDEAPEVIKGMVCYADPAWPWAKEYGGANSNPYKFFSEDLSSILSQEELKTSGNLWLRSGGSEIIFDDVKAWIDTAFEKGASKFILCTQDTNYPAIEEVLTFVKERYKLFDEITIDDWSASANREHKNYWLFLKPR